MLAVTEQGLVVEFDRFLAESANALAEFDLIRGAIVGQGQDEFVAGDMGKQAAIRGEPAESCGEAAQDLITRVLAARLIHEMQVVEVEIQQDDAPARRSRGGDRRCEIAGEEREARQAAHRIVRRESRVCLTQFRAFSLERGNASTQACARRPPRMHARVAGCGFSLARAARAGEPAGRATHGTEFRRAGRRIVVARWLDAPWHGDTRGRT